MICYRVSCGMPGFVMISAVPNSKLLSRTFPGFVLQTTLIGKDYRYFPSHMFKASLARILKFSEKTSFRCLLLSKAITFEPICGSDASSKRFFIKVAFVGVELVILPCIDSRTNEYNE